jgi:Fis family transcriptional regulator
MNETPGCSLSLNGSVRSALKQYFTHLQGEAPADLYQLLLGEVERPLLELTLQYAQGNQTRAAQFLGISRTTLRKKLSQYGLD